MAVAPTPIDGNEYGLWALVIAGCGLVLQLLVNAGSIAWTLSRSKNATDDKIADKDKALTAELIAMERRFTDDMEGVRRDTGETVQAIRAKVSETELWIRDNLVSKETYREVQESVKELRKHVDTRFDRLEEKLEERRN